MRYEGLLIQKAKEIYTHHAYVVMLMRRLRAAGEKNMKIEIHTTRKGFEQELFEYKYDEGEFNLWKKGYGIVVWEHIPIEFNPHCCRGNVSISEICALTATQFSVLKSAACDATFDRVETREI